MPREGYIALWRKSLNSSVFQNEGLWKLWCLCLMKAGHKKSWLSVDGMVKPIQLLPGQFITGRFALHAEYYKRKKKNQKTPLTLWRWMQTLEKLGNLDIKTNNRYSIITIMNWDSYQTNKKQNEHQNEQQVNNRRTTGEQQVNTNNNDNNDNNDNKKDKYGDFVKLTKDEHTKLTGRYSDIAIKSKIEDLNNYIGSTGKKYKSHYHTILAWLRKDGTPVDYKQPSLKEVVS